jgi:hypothetical protein
MTNELTAFVTGNTLPVLSDDALADAISQAQQTTGDGVRDTTFTQYLSFSGKTGLYALGKERLDMDPAAVHIVEPMTFTNGWICWKGGRPVDRVEWSYFDQGSAVIEENLADHGPYKSATGEGWSVLRGFGCMSPDGEQIKFSSNAVSARNAIGDLLNEIKDRSARKEPPIPLIRFDRTQFEAQGTKNWKPVFRVEAWVRREDATGYASGALTLEALLAP